MSDSNYTDLLEALSFSTYVVIVAALQDGKLIDWYPACEYCSLKDLRDSHELSEDVELQLFYGLDALLTFFGEAHEATKGSSNQKTNK